MNIETRSSAEYRRRYAGEAVKSESRLRPQIKVPRPKKIPKTESDWMDRCARIYPGCYILHEPFTLHLPSGTKYTPDVAAVTPRGQILAIWEVKGPHIHNSASIRAWKEGGQ